MNSLTLSNVWPEYNLHTIPKPNHVELQSITHVRIKRMGRWYISRIKVTSDDGDVFKHMKKLAWIVYANIHYEEVCLNGDPSLPQNYDTDERHPLDECQLEEKERLREYYPKYLQQ